MTQEIKEMTLAGQTWPVSFFVLGEQKVVVPLIYVIQAEAAKNGLSALYFEKIMELITYVLKRHDKEMTLAKVEALAVTPTELRAAFRLICVQAGLELNTGEAQAS